MRRVLVLLAVAAALEIALFGLIAAWSADLLRRFPLALWVLVAAGVPYLFAARLSSCHPKNDTRPALVLIFVAAVLMRAPFVLLPPSLSDDIYRYLWDGRVQTHGVNPFRHTPGDQALGHVRDEWHGRVNHPELPTIYPPTAQIVFFLTSSVFHHPVTFKLVFALLDLGCGCLLWLILRNRKMPGATVLWYLWNPLVVIETAYSGHMDALAVFFTLLAFLLATRRRSAPAWVALGCAAMAKLYPLFLAPLFVRKGDWRGPLIFTGTCALLLAPYAGAGTNIFAGLLAYSTSWQFNDSLFGLVAWVMPDTVGSEFLPRFILPTIAAGGSPGVPATSCPLARTVVALVCVALLAWVARRQWTLEQKFRWVLTGLLLLSPTVFAWYAITIVPWVAITRSSPARWALALWTVLLPITYWPLPVYHARGAWLDVPFWAKAVEYGVPLVTAGVIFMVGKVSASRGRRSAPARFPPDDG